MIKSDPVQPTPSVGGIATSGMSMAVIQQVLFQALLGSGALAWRGIVGPRSATGKDGGRRGGPLRSGLGAVVTCVQAAQAA